MDAPPLYSVTTSQGRLANVFAVRLRVKSRDLVAEIARSVIDKHFKYLDVETIVVRDGERPPLDLVLTLSTHYDRVLVVDWRPRGENGEDGKDGEHGEHGDEEGNHKNISMHIEEDESQES